MDISTESDAENESQNRTVEMINEMDEVKFPLLLSQIVQIIEKQGFTNLKVFTNDEEEKLKVSLKLDIPVIRQLVNSIVVMFRKIVYDIEKPLYLQNRLIESMNMNSTKAQAFSNIWSNSAKSIVEKLKEDSVHQFQIQDINWLVSVASATNENSESFEPRAILDLQLKNNIKATPKNNHIIMDFNSTELSKFYDLLENIQSELDKLQP